MMNDTEQARWMLCRSFLAWVWLVGLPACRWSRSSYGAVPSWLCLVSAAATFWVSILVLK